MIKKLYLLAILLACFGIQGISQNITDYWFGTSSRTFSNITGGVSPSWSAGNSDEGYANAIPIGFDFWYMGVRYTTLAASSNGWITFGGAITDAAPINNLTSGSGPRPILAPLWDDLDIQSTDNISYVLTGSAGSRVFTLQYLNVKWGKNATGPTMSFQVNLYEGSGKIEFTYRQEASSLNAPSATIGISAIATGLGNLLSINTNGTSAKATEETNVFTKPLTGNNYVFTPVVPTSPKSLSFSDVTSSALTLNWSDLSSNETGFLIYRSTDGVNYTFVTQTAANATTSAQTGLTPSTTYYWRVFAVSVGASSTTALSGTQATSCLQPAAPTVTSPVVYCQNATAVQLTATGTNLLWGGTAGASGSVGGTTALTTAVWMDNLWNNKKTNFTTTKGNVTITTVDYYVPSWQQVNGLVLSIYNSSGTIIATSSTNTTINPGAAAVAKITNTFNYTIVAAGDYSIGVSSGSGNIGADNPTFPISEATGTINITGVSTSGNRCFNNIQFTIGASATAPIPSTTSVGSTDYQVTQTIGGCESQKATITVNVTGLAMSQVPSAGLIANYKFSGDASDASGNNMGTLQNSPTLTADRFGVANKAYTFNGSSQYVTTANRYTAPANFTISIWFKTASTSGGRLIGFGNSQITNSSQYDRHIYMNDAGKLYFGIHPSGELVAFSPLSYNDNKWHLVTATLSSTLGMSLYADGVLVGSNAAGTIAQDITGYWKIGYEYMNGWISQPTNFYFDGQLDDALIYHRAITASEVATIYNSPDGAGNNGPGCSVSAITLSATTLSGGTYAWTGPNSFSSALQNPTLSYSNAAAGLYTVSATVAGCTATAYTIVTGTTNAGQWTGNVSTDWSNAGNWCTGVVPTATTNVVISAAATRMPTLISSVACKNLTINAGATITTSAAGTLNIAGTLANNGTMTNSGTTNFNGTSGQQTFSGVSSFYNLTVNNTSGLLLPAAITVNNNLLISTGTLNANNFAITIKGNWTNNKSTVAFTAGTATVTFSGTTAQVIGGTFSTTFNNLTVEGTTGTVTLNANASLSGNLTVSSGKFNLAGFTANRSSAGGSITVANNAFLMIGGTNTFPANYAGVTLVVASTVEYSGVNQTVSNQLYGNLTLSSSAGAAVKTFPATDLNIVGNFTSKLGTGTSVTYTAASDITVNGNDSIGASTTFNGGSFSHRIGGNWNNNGTFNGNTGTLTFVGPGTTVSGLGIQNFNNLTVFASFIVFSNASISLTGNLATLSSGSFTQASGGTLSMTGTGKTISGDGILLDNLVISGTVSTAISLVLTGNLSVSGSFTSSTGTITMSGATKTITGAGTKSFGSLLITGNVSTNADFSLSTNLTVNGSLSASAGTATFTGTSTLSGTANLFNTTINGTSLQLSANATLGIASILTISSGTLDVTSSAPNTVNFNGTGAQNINAITYSNLILSNGNTKTAVGGFTTNNDITIDAGTIFSAASYIHSVYGNWINSGTFTTGTSTIQFVGPATAYLTGATTFNILTSNTGSATSKLILNNSVSAAIVNMTQGNISTGSNTLTITNTRTGNGYIYGNIQRIHAFTTGVAYAFEGPDNTITFSAVSAVTSITVSVVQSAASDFPFGGSISRVYTVFVPAGTYIATLRLHYEEEELNGNNEALMGLWNYSGSAWASIGKTANNITANYTEQSGLTNITNRWTCSDDANVVQWNGSVSSNWNTAANWTVLQGSASAPPASTDIVQLGTIPFTNQPTISNTVSVKNINFGSVQAVTLSMASGGSLTTGDIEGKWSINATHVINVNNQTVNINGDLTLSDGVASHAINLNIGSGTVNIGDALIQAGGANIVFVASGNLNIAGDFEHFSGTFTAGTGTVTYNGVSNQHVAHISYNDLSINKAAAIAKIDSTAHVAGNLLISAGQLEVDSTTIIAGNVTISPGAILHNQSILQVGGNWNNTGNFNSNTTGTNVIFNGSGTQTISSTNFDNLEFNKPVGSVAELTGDVTLLGNLVGTSGTLDIKSFLFNRNVKGGSASLANNATLIIGADNAPTNFSNINIGANSTVIFNGTGAQHLMLPGLAYGNLIFRNGGLKTIYNATTVNGDLTIESGAAFDGGSNTITLKGNWINNGTFIPSTSTLLCTGIGKSISGVTTFDRFSVYGSYTVLSDLTFENLFIVNSTGSITSGTSINTTMNGDIINSGTINALGTTTLTCNKVQRISLINAASTVLLRLIINGTVSPIVNSTSAPVFGYITINNTAGLNASVGITVLYALTIGPGAIFNGGISTHSILGDVTNNGTITSAGGLNFSPSIARTVNLGTNFSSTGEIVFGGTGAMTLAGNNLNSFRNVLFSNTNVAGITPNFDWKVSNNFTVSSGSLLNAGSYNYFVGGKIADSGTVNSNTSTFTLNGSAAQDIYSVSPFNNLTLNNTANSVTQSSNITVSKVLNFVAGSIQTGSNLLIQPSAGTITGAAQNTGWVNGNLQKNIATGATTKSFEIGDATRYTPVSLAFSSVTTAGNLTAFTTPGDHPYIDVSGINPAQSVNRFWTLTNSGIGFTNYTATYNFVAADVDGGANTAGFSVANYNGSAWSKPVTASPNPTNIQATGLTTFGEFAVGENCNRNTTIAYAASPSCSSAGTAAVTLTGNTGGIFSSASGLTLDPNSGSVNLSTSLQGSYTVNYTLDAAGGCPSFLTTANIIVTAAPAATISYDNNPYCSSAGTAAITRIGTARGIFSSADTLVIDPATGYVDLETSKAGTYTVTYTVAASGGCSLFTTTTSITVTTQPFLEVAYEGNPYCTTGGMAYPTITAALGAVGTFITTPVGVSIDELGVIDLAASTPGIYSGIYTVPASGGCELYTLSRTVSIVPAGTWTGIFSAEWNDSRNWLCGEIPASTTNVSLDSSLAIYPIVTTTGASNKITIHNGGLLTVTGGTLQIADSINNSGTFEAREGAIEMNGTVAQTLADSTFKDNAVYDFIINNSNAAGVSLLGALDIYGSLTYKGTNRTFNTNDSLTIKSNAANTAWVGDMTGNTINGKVTVERYNSQHKAWRFLSIPTNTTQTIRESWQEGGSGNTDNPVPGFGIQLTGPGGLVAGFDLYTATPSMKAFDEVAENWVGVANTNIRKIKNTEGYMVLIRGNRTSNAYNSPVTESVLRTKGLLYTGSIGPISVIPEKMASIGNPYASPIDFTKIGRTNGVDDKFYLWDPFIEGIYNLGGYQTFSATNDWEPVPGGSAIYPTGVPNTTIQSGQAFFVHATTVAAFLPVNYELTFGENTKIDGSGFPIISRPQGGSGTKSAKQFFRVTLFTGPLTTDVVADGNAVVFGESYSNDIDGHDALKIPAEGENFDIKRSTKLFAVEARGPIVKADTIYYNMSKLAARTYQLRFAPVNLGSGDLEAFLVDKYLNKTTRVSLTDSTFINLTITGVAASGAADRFKVIFKQMAVLPVTITTVLAKEEVDNIAITWTVENESNLERYEIEKSLNGISFVKAGEVPAKNVKAGAYKWLDENKVNGYNYYRIRSVDMNGKTALTQVVKVLIESGKGASISVYPNLILNQVINVQITNSPAGKYQFRLLNSAGQLIMIKQAAFAGGTGTIEFNIHKNLASGIYHLEITNNEGEKKVIKVYQ